MEKPVSVDEARKQQGSLDGYRLFSDKTYGVVHHVGKQKKQTRVKAFGSDMALRDALTMIMPDRWIAYIDEQLVDPGNIDWQSDKMPWVQVLARIGINYGYRFVIDWDQQLIQIGSDKDFTKPDYNDPLMLTDPESGRSVFIYSAKPVNTGGVILVDGKAVKVKLKNN
jgi:hypothetical protein